MDTDILPHIFYINLSHRLDRKKNIETQFKHWPKSKLHRIDAIKKNDGALGCGLSHLKALQSIKKMDVEFGIIIEDDFIWSIDENKGMEYIHNLIKNYKIDWNVILLSCSFEKSKSINNILNKLTSVPQSRCNQATTGYLIKKKYIDRLYSFWDSILKYRVNILNKQIKPVPIIKKIKIRNKLIPYLVYMRPNLKEIKRYTNIDQCWRELHHENWYIFHPQLAKQMYSYSDIDHKMR